MAMLIQKCEVGLLFTVCTGKEGTLQGQGEPCNCDRVETIILQRSEFPLLWMFRMSPDNNNNTIIELLDVTCGKRPLAAHLLCLPVILLPCDKLRLFF